MCDRASNTATYRQLARFARAGLVAGFLMLVDAAFLERERWRAFRLLARRCRAPFLLLQVRASLTLLQARLAARARAGGAPSDAEQAVLACQMTHAVAQGLSADELDEAVAVVNDAWSDGETVAALASRVR